ncbi:MAG: hypothetical protein LN415_04490 [Candidatus Thermoplasmatota archaeon]|nr:hypothetical protein [Candidatus Thermoplasmatota archaeon]
MRRHALPIMLIFFVALTIRLVPLLFSPLPYNIDGFPQARIAEDIMDTGRWYDGGPLVELEYNEKLPILPLYFAISSLAAGEEPLYFIQIAMVLLTSLSAVFVYILAFKITDSRVAAIFAGLFMALCGTYVFLTASIMKQNIGLVLLPIVLYLYHERHNPKYRALAAFLLLFMGLAHHLATLIAFGMITYMMAAQNVESLRRGEWRWRSFLLDVLLGPALILAIVAYYLAVEMPFFMDAMDVNTIFLFMSVYFLVALLAVHLSSPKTLKPWFTNTKRSLPKYIDQKVLFILGAASLLVLNHYTNVFTGTIRTKGDFLIIAAPSIALLFVALVGFNVMRNSETRFRPLITAAFMAPIAVMLFSFLWGLNPESFVVLYRTYDYMDVALAVSIGIAFAVALKKSRSPARKAVLAASFLGLILLTTPLAYGSEDFYDVQNTTYPAEFSAMEHMNALNISNLGSDQRLHDTYRYYFGEDEGDGLLPFRMATGSDITMYDYLLLESKWTTKGAQEHPLPSVVIEDSIFKRTVAEADLIYNSGPGETEIFIVAN